MGIYFVRIQTRMYGSFGQLECDGQKIEHFDFRTQKTTSYTPAASVPPGTKLGGHAGAGKKKKKTKRT